MSFFSRLSAGWSMGMASLKVIRKNKQLVLFPIISGIALILVLASFLGLILIGKGTDFGGMIEESGPADYAITFLYYLVCYFVIVFFNVGLVHCTRIYLNGGSPSFSDGVKYSMGRLPVIMGWAVLSATVGLILKAIEENGGAVGSIISSIVGVAWSIVTFFVVPVLAYENIGPLQAVKRSGSIMKEKWGESLGAAFSFGILTFIGILIIALPIGIIFSLINPIVGIVMGVLAAFIIQSIVSAAEMVFIASVYHQVVEDKPVDEFGSVELDELFAKKEKKGLF
jgi:hypothetical protein